MATGPGAIDNTRTAGRLADVVSRLGVHHAEWARSLPTFACRMAMNLLAFT